jgi:hypothetical protein
MRNEFPEERISFDEIYFHKIFDLMGKETQMNYLDKREKARQAAGVFAKVNEPSIQDEKNKTELITEKDATTPLARSLKNAEKSTSFKNDFSTRDNSPEGT